MHQQQWRERGQAFSLSQVRLKAVVDYVTEVLSHTVKERCMKAAVAEACRGAAAQLRAEAGQRVTSATESSTALTADILRSQLQLAVPLLLLDASSKVRQTLIQVTTLCKAVQKPCPVFYHLGVGTLSI